MWLVSTREWTVFRDGMMTGYGMGYGGIGMILVTVVVILAIAALVKYLMK